MTPSFREVVYPLVERDLAGPTTPRELRALGQMPHEPDEYDGLPGYGVVGTVQEAWEVYGVPIWVRFEYDRLPSARVRAKLMDAVAMVGPRRGHKVLQEALNDVGAGLKVTGSLSWETFAAVGRLLESEEVVVQRMCARLVDFLTGLGGPEVFGWAERGRWIPPGPEHRENS